MNLDVVTSNSSSDGTYFYIAPNDGSTGNIERLRITSAGKLTVTPADTTSSYATTDGGIAYCSNYKFNRNKCFSKWRWYLNN